MKSAFSRMKRENFGSRRIVHKTGKRKEEEEEESTLYSSEAFSLKNLVAEASSLRCVSAA